MYIKGDTRIKLKVGWVIILKKGGHRGGGERSSVWYPPQSPERKTLII